MAVFRTRLTEVLDTKEIKVSVTTEIQFSHFAHSHTSGSVFTQIFRWLFGNL